jgi:outer membrane lipoprotein-sorting protein
MSRLMLLCLLFLGVAARAQEPDTAPVKRWLALQDNLQSMKAEFTQTRSFHALRDPLVSTGTFWFVAPGSFRCEIGAPPKMIFLRMGDSIYMIRPEKKRAQAFAVNDLEKKTSPALFRFPVAKNYDDFCRQFELRQVTVVGNRAHIEVVSRDATVRQLITYTRFDFEVDTGNLLAVEMGFKDGTSMRNDFKNIQINPKIDPAIFHYDLTGFLVAGGNS